MEHVYAVQTAEELTDRQRFVQENWGRIEEYIRFLEQHYAVEDLPRAFVWTTRAIATRFISDSPLPAYTNDVRVVFDPDLEDWRDIYLAQLDGLPDREEVRQVRAHDQHGLSRNHVLQIIGHELAHHSELFLDEVYDTEPWFEEGMAEYISSRYFLTAAEFEAQVRADRLLVDLLEPRYGRYPLEQFGAETYQRDFAGIFFDYRRAFLAICRLADRWNGDIQSVFRACHQWHKDPQGQTLAEYLQIER